MRKNNESCFVKNTESTVKNIIPFVYIIGRTEINIVRIVGLWYAIVLNIGRTVKNIIAMVNFIDCTVINKY